MASGRALVAGRYWRRRGTTFLPTSCSFFSFDRGAPFAPEPPVPTVCTTEAAITTPMATSFSVLMFCASSSHPKNAAKTGSREIRMEKTLGASPRSAINSKEYGTSDPKIPVPMANHTVSVELTRFHAPPAPIGSIATPPTTNATANPPWPGTSAPAFLFARI